MVKRPALQRTYHVGGPYKRARLATMVRNLRETKYKNQSISHIATTTSTTIISNVSSGDSVEDRDGRKILMVNCEIRLRVGGSNARIVIYVPKDPTATLALTTDADAIDNDEYWVIFDRLFTGHGEGVFAVNLRIPQKLGIEFATSGGSAIKNPVKMYLHTSSASSISGHTKMWYKDI